MAKGNGMSSHKATDAYREMLNDIVDSGIPFMVAGTYALNAYTGITRPTKDFDIFCKPGDYPKLLNYLQNQGYETEITDDRWLAKIYKKTHYMDIIFGIFLGYWSVDDTWFEHAPVKNVLGLNLRIVPPEEIIWSKAYMQERDKYEGPDINHLILRCGHDLDWKRLMRRMELHWELLLGHLINFRFVYPSDRTIIPKWVIEELFSRLQSQLNLPPPKGKICRGDLLSRSYYDIDYKQWGYQTTSQHSNVTSDKKNGK